MHLYFFLSKLQAFNGWQYRARIGPGVNWGETSFIFMILLCVHWMHWFSINLCPKVNQMNGWTSERAIDWKIRAGAHVAHFNFHYKAFSFVFERIHTWFIVFVLMNMHSHFEIPINCLCVLRLLSLFGSSIWALFIVTLFFKSLCSFLSRWLFVHLLVFAHKYTRTHTENFGALLTQNKIGFSSCGWKINAQIANRNGQR